MTTARPSGGGMAEWLKATVLKTVRGRKVSRGFESLSLRHGPLGRSLKIFERDNIGR